MPTPSDITKKLRDLVKVESVALELAKRFDRGGKALYLVGGSVRDAILGKRAGDMDFATDAKPDEVLEIVRGWSDAQKLVGIEFGTVGVLKEGHWLEITTFRSERYPEDSRRERSASMVATGTTCG